MEENVKYLYHGIQLTDQSVISYYKQAHYIQKLENKLVGNFDKNGKYTISNDILKELVALKKVIDKTEDNKIFATAKCGKYNFKFVIETGTIDTETKYASLKLVEEFSIVTGDKKTTMMYPVVYYKDADNQYFKEKIYKLLNLFTKDESEGKQFNNEDLAKVILKNLSLGEKSLSLFIKQTRLKDKLYVENMLKIFEKSGKFGEFALRRYNHLLKEYASLLDPKSDNYYHILKQLIDKIMMEEEKNVSKEVALLLQRLRKKYVQSIDNFIEVVIKNPPKKVEEKPIKLKGTGGLVFKGNAYKSPGAKKDKPKPRSLIMDNDGPTVKKVDVKPEVNEIVEENIDYDWEKDIKDFVTQMNSLDKENDKIVYKKNANTLHTEENKQNVKVENEIEIEFI